MICGQYFGGLSLKILGIKISSCQRGAHRFADLIPCLILSVSVELGAHKLHFPKSFANCLLVGFNQWEVVAGDWKGDGKKGLCVQLWQREHTALSGSDLQRLWAAWLRSCHSATSSCSASSAQKPVCAVAAAGTLHSAQPRCHPAGLLSSCCCCSAGLTTILCPSLNLRVWAGGAHANLTAQGRPVWRPCRLRDLK